MPFPDFFGNPRLVAALERMISQRRIPQSLLLAGPEGVGKATLARRFGAALLGGAPRIEQDDLSLPANAEMLADREKWPAERRGEEPLLLSTHPDFVTVAPDGPLRQISIQQMRALKERAQFGPLKGQWRVFLVDRIDRANEQAANSLLKTLEEPPPYLILILTAENAYDLLPTIRSRSVILDMTPLTPEEMRAFAASRGLDPEDRRFVVAGGAPGVAVTLDLEAYDRRAKAMLALLEVAGNRKPFSAWTRYSEAISASKSEKLDYYLRALHGLLEDLLLLQHHGEPRHHQLAAALADLAAVVSFEWLMAAVKKVDELAALVRRNIQKGIALDALALELRRLG